MSLDGSHKEQQFIVASFFFSLVPKFATPTSIIDQHASCTRDQERYRMEKGGRGLPWKSKKIDKQITGEQRREDAIKDRKGKIKRDSVRSMIAILS